jgi:hypothetical protein
MATPDSFTFILQDSLVKVNFLKLFFRSASSRVGQSKSSIDYIPFPNPCQAYFAAISRFFARAPTPDLQVAISCATSSLNVGSVAKSRAWRCTTSQEVPCPPDPSSLASSAPPENNPCLLPRFHLHLAKRALEKGADRE